MRSQSHLSACRPGDRLFENFACIPIDQQVLLQPLRTGRSYTNFTLRADFTLLTQVKRGRKLEKSLALQWPRRWWKARMDSKVEQMQYLEPWRQQALLEIVNGLWQITRHKHLFLSTLNTALSRHLSLLQTQLSPYCYNTEFFPSWLATNSHESRIIGWPELRSFEYELQTSVRYHHYSFPTNRFPVLSSLGSIWESFLVHRCSRAEGMQITAVMRNERLKRGKQKYLWTCCSKVLCCSQQIPSQRAQLDLSLITWISEPQICLCMSLSKLLWNFQKEKL